MQKGISPVADGTVTTPRGFIAGATYAGLKTYAKDKLDLALLVSEAPCAAAGVFTQSKIVSATVPLSKGRVSSGHARAIVVNSGCANACVGPQGMLDAQTMSALAAKKAGVREDEVLIASTGMIGVELPMAAIRSGLSKIKMHRDGGAEFARAIITTDKTPKTAAVSIELDGKPCTIAAAAKGAGMIHPNMATMLCFVTTDAAVEPGALQWALKAAAGKTFNMITVDGDTSTNDMIVVLANGMAGNRPVQAETAGAELLAEALEQVCLPLAKMIVKDGEGATKLMEVRVEGAASAEDARKAARTIVSSPLVKSAIHGADPNWGRVIAALGRSGAALQETKTSLWIQEVCVFDQGAPIPFHKEAARAKMMEDDVMIVARLGMGTHNATAWGCDLSEDYVRFNSEYST
ncbi:MAG: bifunctional glutamate N-acetyltransferase/amino-acid acetyltransferase ArgJ [Chloroflexi bacterium]|nr:bifunctional glutamate N-acetyltransferase/amino-acid acetyltransferase ArgJ [Chloroflexota bacterium]